ncbi:uncharacterized protein LOC113552092 [Rhopalosiphum maidis]|uniref:uncharacterized protein LOC113552092 n=1 Tax=Rhopalosiphum maidis TaxID=43146 RepID=UPI000F00E812|nr:uncharacterized protein LOC113552092 [Rhopalosiphum maidis]
MFVLSHTVVSVFAVAVLLNIFYFDPVQSFETSEVYNTCQLCINSPCHKQYNNYCGPGAGNYTLCYKCSIKTPDSDQQFNTQSDCMSSCSDPSKCRCDDACWVCVLKGNPNAMKCANVQKMYNDNCQLVPFVG